MSLFVQLVLQVLLPAILLFDLFKKEYKQRRNWIIDVVLVAAVLLLVFQIARWDFFSYYLRIALLPIFGLVAYVAYRCIDRKKKSEPLDLSPRDYAVYGVKGLVILGAIAVNIYILSGALLPGTAVELAHPLRGGVYFVGGGGANRWINNHHAFPPQDYALDIVRLNAFGSPAKGVKPPEELNEYAIFGDRVYCPCSGRVIVAEDGLPDNQPPEKDSEHLAGNHIVVACEGVEVLLAHLQNGSITVAVGDEVTEGAVIGQVGNSGNSTQPHLHIHAERGGAVGKILEGEGVPIQFNGRFLVRNSLFSGRLNTEE